MAMGQVTEPVQRAVQPGQMPGAAGCAVVLTLLASFAVISQAAPAQADTLRKALDNTYRTNPRLDAARARLRAFDEDVPQALSGWRPVIIGSGDAGYQSTKTKPRTTSSGSTNNWGYSLKVTQNLFDGFQTTNRVKGAEASVRAQRETLRLVEQQVLLQAVTAYMNVIRDRAIVNLNKNNVYVLTRALRAARARRAEREITRTDVAQSRARRARAISRLDDARATLKASQAVYRQVIGVRPGKLRAPSYRNSLIPSTLRAALKLAQDNHPTVVAAKYREQAERYHVDRVRGELLPDVRVEASYGRRFNDTVSVSQQEDARITGRITVPFYRGGQVYSRVRQAKHRHVARLQEIEQARQEVEAQVMSAWSRLRAERSRVRSDKVQVAAARTALEGVREEEQVGQRTIIELLNAQQELINANVALTRTRRDLVVAAYTMIAAVGRLSARQLAVAPEVYDPEEHYFEVRNQRFGISIASDEQRDEHDEFDLGDDESMLGAPPARRLVKTRQARKRARRVATPRKAGSRKGYLRQAALRQQGKSSPATSVGYEKKARHGDRRSGEQRRVSRKKPQIDLGTEIRPGLVPVQRAKAHSKTVRRRIPLQQKSDKLAKKATKNAMSNVAAIAIKSARSKTPAPMQRARPLTTASIGLSGRAAGSSILQRRVSQKASKAPPVGFRGAMGNADSQLRVRQFRPAANLSLVNRNRQVTVIRGATLD